MPNRSGLYNGPWLAGWTFCSLTWEHLAQLGPRGCFSREPGGWPWARPGRAASVPSRPQHSGHPQAAPGIQTGLLERHEEEGRMQPPAPGRIRGPQRVTVDLALWGRERPVPWQTARAPHPEVFIPGGEHLFFARLSV